MAAAVALCHASWLLTAVAPALRSPISNPVLKVCTINVRLQNVSYDLILDSLREMNPDVIAFLELGSALEKTLVGDMNLTPWSALLADLLGAAGIHDASRGYELTPTWYRWPFVCGGTRTGQWVLQRRPRLFEANSAGQFRLRPSSCDF